MDFMGVIIVRCYVVLGKGGLLWGMSFWGLGAFVGCCAVGKGWIGLCLEQEGCSDAEW